MLQPTNPCSFLISTSSDPVITSFLSSPSYTQARMSTQYKYGPSKVKEFYADNTVVFLTGATGFVGKTILEKLLRSFPEITK